MPNSNISGMKHLSPKKAVATKPKLSVSNSLTKKSSRVNQGYQSKKRRLLTTNKKYKRVKFQPLNRSLKQVDGNADKVDIVICVKNSLSDVEQCLNSLFSKQSMPFNLILVDDGSDNETRNYLQDFAYHYEATLLRLPVSIGYTAAANRGLKLSSANYVVLLNSDTIVTRSWLEKLLACAKSCHKTGITGPVSNAASWQSVPELYNKSEWKINSLPSNINVEMMAAIVESSSCRQYPEIPILNGFCLLIKREVIDSIGFFDENTFVAYGEENDYCIRAKRAGFKLRVADDCYIYHSKSKSFGLDNCKILRAKAQKNLVAKYGNETISDFIKQIKSNYILSSLRKHTAKLSLELTSSSVLNKSILFLLPAGRGSGGANSVVQEVMGLRELGIDARIMTSRHLYNKFLKVYPETEDFCLTFLEESDLFAQAINFDIVIATIFFTVPWLAQIKSLKPSIIAGYYIQDYEPWFFEEDDPRRMEAAQTYNLIPDIVAFAKTDWLCDKVSGNHGTKVTRVKASLDTRLYNPYLTRITDSMGPIQITAMLRPSTPRRAPIKTLQVLKEIKKRFDDQVKITTFGCDPAWFKKVADQTDFEFTHFAILQRWEVAKLLSESDIFLDMSVYQAFGRTGLEAMALGCAVIIPEHGGASEYAIDNKNSLVIDTQNVDNGVNAIEMLITNRQLLNSLKKAGVETAKRYSVRGAAFSEILCFENANTSV